MNEISSIGARALLSISATVGLPLDELTAGLRFDESSIRRMRRVHWDDYCTLLERMERKLGGPAELEYVASNYYLAAVPAELRIVFEAMISPKTLYRFMVKVVAPPLFPNIECDHVELPDGRIRISVLLRPYARSCLAFSYLNVAAVRCASGHIGLPMAEVEVEELTDRSLVVLARLPPSHTLVARARRPSMKSLRRAALGLLGRFAEESQVRGDTLHDTREIVNRQQAQLADIAALGRELARHIDLSALAEALVATLVNLGWRRVALHVVSLDRSESALVRSHGEGPVSQVFTLQAGGRGVGQLEVGGAGDSKLLAELVPWIAICVDNARTFAALVDTRSLAGGASVAARLSEMERALELTARQSEVLALIVRGLSNKEIAVELSCAENTVELHVTAVLRKSAVSSRTQLIAKFWAPAHPRLG